MTYREAMEAMATEADAELIARARHDRVAFGELYRLYVNRVYLFCLTHTGHHEQAEDLTSQTFERALRTIHRYDDRGTPFSRWLLRIAASALGDYRRHHGRDSIMLVDESVLDEIGSREPVGGLERLVEHWERADRLQTHMLAALSPDQRLIIQLRFYEDRTLDDVATLMGRNPAAARQFLHRTIAALRVHMAVEDEDSIKHGGSRASGDA